MNRIQITLLGGAIVYGLLFAMELIQGHVLWQAIIGIALLAFLAVLPHTKEDHMLHTGEMIAIWICILLFGLYAILKSGGLV